MIPTYVVHCAELPQRTAVARAHITEQIPDAIFYRSIHGSTWGIETTREFDPDKRISPGHVGLLLGHWSVWNHLSHTLKHDAEAAIVLEDDAVLPPDFWNKLTGVWNDLDVHFPDWNFVFLGLAEQDNPGLWNKISDRVGPPDGRLCRVNWPWGTHAIMLRKSALPVLLDQMCLAERNIDQQLYERVLRPGLVNWCAVVPSLISQRTYDYSGGGSPEWAPSTITNIDGGDDLFWANQPLQDANRAYVGHRVTPEAALGAKPAAVAEMVRDAGGLRPNTQTPETIAATLQLTEPYPCIYRGESDAPVVHAGRVVTTWQCGRLNKPCHQKAKLGVPGVVACETCDLRLGMGLTGAARDRLPLPDGHFNPSFALYQGRLILATRDSWGHSKVGLWELTNAAADWSGAWTVKPIGSYASGHPDAPRLEDPRLYVAADGRLHASFSMPDGYPPKLVRVGDCAFTADLSGIESCEVFDSPHGNAYEKNWMPFRAAADEFNVTRWVYNSKPQHVIYNDICGDPSDKLDVYNTPNNFAWTGGVVRGGAPPVLHDGVYYHFFHGCLKRPYGNVYTVGCYTFDPTPPFRVLRQTPVPLIWPDQPGPGESVVKRYVVFPGGCIAHAGAWHVVCGIDDCTARVYRLPFSMVEAALNQTVADNGSVSSIRESAINSGTPDAERPRD